VRLVERVDREHVARDRGRELPAVELAAEVVRIDEVELAALPVPPVRGLARRGHEPLAELPRRLCEQLLRPEPEAGRRVVDADLVPALLPGLPEQEAELEARVAVLTLAG